MTTPISKEDWHQLRIQSKAKELAWKDLDQYDQKMYLREAEKELNKHKALLDD